MSPVPVEEASEAKSEEEKDAGVPESVVETPKEESLETEDSEFKEDAETKSVAESKDSKEVADEVSNQVDTERKDITQARQPIEGNKACLSQSDFPH